MHFVHFDVIVLRVRNSLVINWFLSYSNINVMTTKISDENSPILIFLVQLIYYAVLVYGIDNDRNCLDLSPSMDHMQTTEWRTREILFTRTIIICILFKIVIELKY